LIGIADVLRRSVGVLDALNRVGGKVLHGSVDALPFVAPWIEPRLRSWLADLPQEKPVFAFVNLIEAHEPYLIGGGFPVGFREWLRASVMVNASERWLLRRSSPSESYLQNAKLCYRRTIEAIDLRLARIIQVLQECGRWDNTAFILTSDHGQSFWERNWFGHRAHLDESICRIPLWIRPPRGRQLRLPLDEWVSLVDVARTVASLAGRSSFGDPRSVDLSLDIRRRGGGAVYSFSDGILEREIEGLPDEVRGEVDRLVLASYYGSSKTECSWPGAIQSFGVSIDGPLREATTDPTAPDVMRCREMATTEFDRVLTSISQGRTGRAYGRRLMGWGY
jgi:hypothetical protein